MDKGHKIIVSVIALQTAVLGGLVVGMTHPVVKVVREVVTVVATPTPTPKLLVATPKPSEKAMPKATSSAVRK